jgi:pimeloyl-ACP methyl ester carboxylesterase
MRFLLKINALLSFFLLFNATLHAQKKAGTGLQIGDDSPSLIPFHAWGDDKGSRACPVCKYGQNYGIIYFVGNQPDWIDIENWLIFLEKESLKRGKILKVYFVYGNEIGYSKAKRQSELEALGVKLKIKKLALTFVSSLSDTETEVHLNQIPLSIKNAFIVYKKRVVLDVFENLKATETNFKKLTFFLTTNNFENPISNTTEIHEQTDTTEIYNKWLGDYVTRDNQLIAITRSQRRLYAYFENSQVFRGLNKINDTTFSSGKTVVSQDTEAIFQFSNNRLIIQEKNKTTIYAFKKDLYLTKNVSFFNKNQVKLSGTLFLPNKPNGKAVVLVHGSGEQDRNGYASIIRLLADVFARQGIVVLTYDKQGIGNSEGNWASMSFKDLADDALSGITFLKKRHDIDVQKIGLAGSSQAGWVIAKALEKSQKEVDFALLIGAAGSGISVIDQNLYNTEMQMTCLGSFSKQQIDQALLQQWYFLKYVSTSKYGAEYDKITAKISQDTLIRDWLFPLTKDIDLKNRSQWFTALELAFDPLPIWGNFDRPSLMLFSEFDDATPTEKVIVNINALKNSKIKTVVIPKAQHIGLETDNICKAEIVNLKNFNPLFLKELINWLHDFDKK